MEEYNLTNLADPPKIIPITVGDQLKHLADTHDDPHCWCGKGYTYLTSPAGPILNVIAKLGMLLQQATTEGSCDPVQLESTIRQTRAILAGTEWESFIK